MCKKCGCNTCETDSTALMLNESKAPRSILSEGLKHHMDANKPLTDNFYTAGSRDYFDLIAEARSLYSRGILEFTNKRDIELLTETDQGHFGVYEGKKVPLDFPMLNEEVDSYYLDNAKEKLSNAYKILGKEKGQTRRGDKYLQVNYIPKSSPQTQRPEFVKVFYDNDNDLKGLDLPMLNEIEIGDRVKIDKAYGGGKGEVKDKKGSFIVVNGKSYHESDVKLINEAELQYPDFDLNKNIKYQDTSISSGMWRYTGTEQGGKGVYRNLNNDQILGFDRSDFDIFRKNLSSHFDIDEELNEAKKAKKKEKKDPPIGKPKRGGSKAYYVYVRSPKTKKIKKVSFGSGGLRAKIKNKKARNAFAARHNCKNKKDRTTAGYWSCNLPRYASQLGLGANQNTFW